MILVHDGVYEERIDFKGKVIIVRSENGPNSTIIDGGSNGSVVSFVGVNDSVLDGFTIKNGQARYGSGIIVSFPLPLLLIAL